MDPADSTRRFGPGSKEPTGSGTTTARIDSEAVVRAVRAFQAGIEREESFRVLFETYRPAVQGFFLRRLGSLDAARDLTQETFLKVYQGLKGYRGDAPFGAWMFRIARNVLSDRNTGSAAARLRAREVGLEDVKMDVAKVLAERTADGAGSDRPFRAVLDAEKRRILRCAIDELPPQRRRCVILWAYHELTYEQIAVVMRLSIGTIKAHLAQAREQLARLVHDKVQPQEP